MRKLLEIFLYYCLDCKTVQKKDFPLKDGETVLHAYCEVCQEPREYMAVAYEPTRKMFCTVVPD